jgi:carbonic anhydrase
VFLFNLQNAYPLELHFVHFKEAYGSELGKAVAGGRGANDTLAVLGVLFKIQENDNLDLNAILEAMNGAEAKGEILTFPKNFPNFPIFFPNFSKFSAIFFLIFP